MSFHDSVVYRLPVSSILLFLESKLNFKAHGELNTCTYGEVSWIFLGLNIAESDILRCKLTDIISMTFSENIIYSN